MIYVHQNKDQINFGDSDEEFGKCISLFSYIEKVFLEQIPIFRRMVCRISEYLTAMFSLSGKSKHFGLFTN